MMHGNKEAGPRNTRIDANFLVYLLLHDVPFSVIRVIRGKIWPEANLIWA